jgi:hypothetical protein
VSGKTTQRDEYWRKVISRTFSAQQIERVRQAARSLHPQRIADLRAVRFGHSGALVLDVRFARRERSGAVVGRHRRNALLLQLRVGFARVEILVQHDILRAHSTESVSVERLLHELGALVATKFAVVVDAGARNHDVAMFGTVHHRIDDLYKERKKERGEVSDNENRRQ